MKSIKDLYQYIEDQFGSDRFGLHSYGYAQGWAIAKNIEDEIADNYMRLPLDENNVTIHVGDICEMNEVRFKVRQLCTDGNCWWAVDGTGEFYIAELCRHVKPRTLEDVLREYGHAYYAHMTDNYMNYDGTDEQVIGKYADEIRELLGGDEI